MSNFFRKKNSGIFVFVFWCMIVFLQNSTVAEELSLEDPTRPSNFVDAKKSDGDKANAQYNDFLLQAVIVSDTHRVAIINEKILEVGGLINSKQVVSIDEEKVILSQKNKKDLVLKLSDIDIKEVSK